MHSKVRHEAVSSIAARLRPALLGLCALACALSIERLAWACDFGVRAMQREGILGLPLVTLSDRPMPQIEPLPRNLALFTSRVRPIVLEVDGGAVALEPLGPEAQSDGDLSLVSVASPLPEGSLVVVRGQRNEDPGMSPLPVGSVIDETPPQTPVVTEAVLDVHDGETACGGDSCGDFASLTLRLQPPADDDTPSHALVYAVYFGRSAKAAREARRPATFVLLEAGEAFEFVDFRWGEADVFASVTAVDRAGNESERSEPMKIYDDPGGCLIGRPSRAAGDLSWVVAALWLLAGRRRDRVAGGRSDGR